MNTFEFAQQEQLKYGIDAIAVKEPALPSFEVRIKNGQFVIAYPSEVEYLYGVYACAEKFGGYTFFEPGRDLFNADDVINVKALPDGICIPAKKPLLKTRGFVQEFPFNSDNIDLFDWMGKNCFNYLQTWLCYYDNITEEQKEAARIRCIEIEPGHHSFNYWIPGKLYAKEHPEFFAMINGQRISPSNKPGLLLSEQLCTTNPELRNELVRRIVEYCKAHPEVKTTSLTPNDGFGWCECPECSKFYDKNKKGELYSVSDHVYMADRIYHDFIKDVSEKFHAIMPDIRLTFSAYVNYCRPAPGMTLPKGLTVCMALYWRCINHDINDSTCPINSHYADDLLAWNKVKDGGELWVYEYYMGINFYISLPMIHFHELFREFRWYQEHGIDGVITQFHIPHWNVYGLNYYLMGKAARGEDENTSIDEIFRRLFGKKDAAEAMAFYDDVKQVLLSAGQCHIPYPYSLFSRTTLEQYQQLHKKAEAFASKAPESTLRSALVIWMEYLCRYKMLFDKNTQGQATPQDIQDLLKWAHSHDGKRLFVLSRFDTYFNKACKMIESGKKWLHYGIDWEDKVILREEKEYFQK